MITAVALLLVIVGLAVIFLPRTLKYFKSLGWSIQEDEPRPAPLDFRTFPGEPAHSPHETDGAMTDDTRAAELRMLREAWGEDAPRA